MTTTGLLVRRYVSETARNRVTVSMLVVVPVVFVAVAAQKIADAAELLGGQGGVAVETATAGWAAAFVSAIAMYFQVRSARATDRRLVLAGLASVRLVAARLATGLALAVTATAAALVTLAARTGISVPGRTIAGTLMFAVIYLGIGALIGALVPEPVNGTVLVFFVWILDVFFGPAFGAADRVVTRPLPTHFAALWMMDLPSRHGGRIGDLGWALVWTVAALAVSWAVVAATSRAARPRRPAGQLATALRMGLREAGRNRVLWALLIAVPTAFILLAAVSTPDEYQSMVLTENGRRAVVRFWFPDAHPGFMAPVSIATLAALVGLFTALQARSGDQRLFLAGLRVRSLLTARLSVVALGALVATAASLAVTAALFDPRQWGLYLLANLLMGLTYGLIGVLIGSFVGRVGGVFVAFLVPFLDIGIEQSPMLNSEVSGVGRTLPGYGASRVLYDAALTGSFDETGPLLIALAWLAGLTIAAALLFRHAVRTTAV
ncbi:ABC transporter permease [Streptomyces sp. S.PB5]|uniref:ABC transporter permease n=1 Tax=Streptomyces sp. S.PB5 TaxID=3020844 RepID=UPI0025B060C8|nr:ABC transporter permease [Streptomyces sp. S.PB5]MDN3029525.1 ABC transporter permease [Streptomyces sp. S.PB5]